MIGRKWAVKKIRANLRRKQNTLVIGQSGIGKSTVLRHIAAELGDGAYYIEALWPPRSAMLLAVETIGDFSEAQMKAMKVSQWTLDRITKELIALVDGRDFVLVVDTLDKVTAAASEWLKALAESPITLLGACNTVPEGKGLDRFFWTFETIVLKPMSDAEIKGVIQTQVYPYGADAPRIAFKDRSAQRYFVERVIKASKGVPLTAVICCRKAAGVKAVSMTFVKETLMAEHEASVKWIDATPLLLIGICFVLMMRYVARGMHSQDAYVFFGALSAIVFVMRFFIFRRRKR